MAERTIVGVDFSGAGEDNVVGKTWVTEARFDTDIGRLEIEGCQRFSRVTLAQHLGQEDYAVAAMDFPFGVPTAFAIYWAPNALEMPDLWQVAYELGDRRRFREIVDEFAPAVADEFLRVGDLHVPGCYSCLHRVSPNMVPMTFEGMKLLHNLWENGGFHVPPLLEPEDLARVLLEVMPGAALASWDLPHRGYKNGRNAQELRTQILDGLSEASGIELINLEDFRDLCMDNDDALDSIVAAVVAALWAMNNGDNAFIRPSANHIVQEALQDYEGARQISAGINHLTEVQAARLEGWIYAPMPPAN